MDVHGESNIQKICEALSLVTNYAIPVNQDFYSIAQIAKLLDICYMFESFKFDYSELPLDDLKPTIFHKDERALYNLFGQIERCETDIGKNYIELMKINKSIKDIQHSYKSQNEKDRIIELLESKKQLFEARNEETIKEHEAKEKEAYDMMEYQEEHKKYLYNKTIIERLRDSISHGNVLIKPNGAIEDAIIQFQDKYNGEVAFELEVSLKTLKFTLDECIKTICSDEKKIRSK